MENQEPSRGTSKQLGAHAPLSGTAELGKPSLLFAFFLPRPVEAHCSIRKMFSWRKGKFSSTHICSRAAMSSVVMITWLFAGQDESVLSSRHYLQSFLSMVFTLLYMCLCKQVLRRDTHNHVNVLKHLSWFGAHEICTEPCKYTEAFVLVWAGIPENHRLYGL